MGILEKESNDFTEYLLDAHRTNPALLDGLGGTTPEDTCRLLQIMLRI